MAPRHIIEAVPARAMAQRFCDMNALLARSAGPGVTRGVPRRREGVEEARAARRRSDEGAGAAPPRYTALTHPAPPPRDAPAKEVVMERSQPSPGPLRNLSAAAAFALSAALAFALLRPGA